MSVLSWIYRVGSVGDGLQQAAVQLHAVGGGGGEEDHNAAASKDGAPPERVGDQCRTIESGLVMHPPSKGRHRGLEGQYLMPRGYYRGRLTTSYDRLTLKKSTGKQQVPR